MDRHPVGARGQDCRGAQANHKIEVIRTGERLVKRRINIGPWQAAAVLVNENVEGIGRARSIEIRTQHVHLGDIPSLSSGHDEIVSSEVVKCVEIWFEVLRPRAESSSIVVLIVKDYVWNPRHWQKAQQTRASGTTRNSGRARRQAGANIVWKKL